MTHRTSSERALLLSLALCLCPLPAAAQQTAADRPAPTTNAPASPPARDERAEQVLARAVAALGGDAYLAIRSTTGRGIYTRIVKGMAEPPSTFVDYLVFPDRERTEFRGGGNRTIQTNTGTTGWLYDAAARALKDLPPADIENFRLSLRTSLDNLLRGWWRKEGATLTYAGRQEAGVGRRNETVRLTYPDGFTVDFEIGAKDGLPAKARYRRKNSAGEEVQEEDRYGRFLTIGGVTLPYVVDHYRAGDPTSRISFDAIEFNRPIADTLFDRPANFKAVK
ncbi:MAG TPA: hypothetical protein VF546_14890 [Pyrinomonadaceae bacterium]|jgi:hypothetical protein